MRPLSHVLLLCLPTLLGVAVLLFFAAPFTLNTLSLAPNVVWLMTLVASAVYPAAWPYAAALLVGLLQDVLYATPLGSQAVLAVLLALLMRWMGRRSAHLPFRVRWLEAAVALLVWHGLLWLVLYVMHASAPASRPLLVAGLVSAAWYPVFYIVLTRLFRLLPAVGALR